LGRADEGIPLLAAGLGAFRDYAFVVFRPWALTLLADAYGMDGQWQDRESVSSPPATAKVHSTGFDRREGSGLSDRYGRPMRERHNDDDQEGDDRRTAALMGLAIVLSLAVAGVVLIRDLSKEAELEHCLMSGRTNCEPIKLPLRR
jgi:hypothetical protein